MSVVPAAMTPRKAAASSSVKVATMVVWRALRLELRRRRSGGRPVKGCAGAAS